ncbi:MAG: hypothetical protein JWM19_6253 [Actinomycetia bacterium]|nr:hypothetical protein [Actinomycetes bacterium]
MAAQTWDSALARARAVVGQVPHVAANIAVLTQLRERWRDSVDVLASMFDLMIVPSGAGWPGSGDEVFVRMTHDQRSGEPVVKVVLYRSRVRASLAEPGGTVIVAGDICRLPTAPAVVEAFLWQIARPVA